MDLKYFMHRAKVPLPAKALYLYIWEYPSHEFTKGRKQLFKQSHTSDRQLRKWIKALEAAGYLGRRNRHNGLSGHPAIIYYCINPIKISTEKK